MARITIEDCLSNENNRFNLVRLAAKRAKQLLLGKKPVTDTKNNKAIVSALREIAAGKVRFSENEDQVIYLDDANNSELTSGHVTKIGMLKIGQSIQKH